MKKDKMHKFLDDKSQIVDNLESLKINLEEIEKISLFDPDETQYNEILSLIDEAKAADNDLALSEVIPRAKTIETKLDSWFSKEGIETLELSWPVI
ncbi:MAG: hypothetical protein KR126chlam6_01332 [Candidatus Anoxychlamydiales bacterium]|nr:hypothetical protein [Candidatus Anoxychlamydiales bacterium]